MSYFAAVFLLLIVILILWFVPIQRALLSGLQMVVLGALVVSAFTIWNMVYQVPAGHSGIVYAFGGIVGQRGEGLQWVAPWQEVKYASVQVQGHSFPKLESFSKQSQDVYVAATINVQVSPQNIQDLYRDVGRDYFNVLVRPRLFQAIKDETVKYDSVDIAPNRENIRKAVRERLTKELEAHSISVQDLLIDNISFSPKFQDAIEEKQRQSQLALAEREKVAGEKAKADQAIEQARGQAQAILVNAEKQAEANRKLAESITPEYIQYLFASKLAPNVSVMMVPSGQPFILSPDMLKRAPAAAPQR
jgi:regulator of protease activity HflC (stomatin/prohibitin superfamily)